MGNNILFGNIDVKHYLSSVSETPLWNLVDQRRQPNWNLGFKNTYKIYGLDFSNHKQIKKYWGAKKAEVHI